MYTFEFGVSTSPMDQSWTIAYAKAILGWFGAGAVLMAGVVVVSLVYGSRATLPEYALMAGGVATLAISFVLWHRLLTESKRRRESFMEGGGP